MSSALQLSLNNLNAPKLAAFEPFPLLSQRFSLPVSLATAPSSSPLSPVEAVL